MQTWNLGFFKLLSIIHLNTYLRFGDVVGAAEIEGTEETEGESEGAREIVGEKLGAIVGCIPGKHSILLATLSAASQQVAMPHFSVLSLKA